MNQRQKNARHQVSLNTDFHESVVLRHFTCCIRAVRCYVSVKVTRHNHPSGHDDRASMKESGSLL